MENGKQSINDKDACHKVEHIEYHTLQSGRNGLCIRICEVRQSRAVLVESHPEEDDHCKYEAEADNALFRFGRREGLGSVIGFACFFLLVGIGKPRAQAVIYGH